jgi:hypothetical protein
LALTVAAHSSYPFFAGSARSAKSPESDIDAPITSGGPEKVVAPPDEFGDAVFADDEHAPKTSAAATHAATAELDLTVRAMLPPTARHAWSLATLLPMWEHCYQHGTCVPNPRQLRLVASRNKAWREGHTAGRVAAELRTSGKVRRPGFDAAGAAIDHHDVVRE